VFIKLARFIYAAAFAALLCAPAVAQGGPSDEALKLLPEQVGEFRATGPASEPLGKEGLLADVPLEGYEDVSGASRHYASRGGEKVNALLLQTRTEGAAYSLLTARSNDVKIGCEFAAACVSDERGVSFFKGPAYVSVSPLSGDKKADAASLTDFARRLSETLDAGAGSIPPLALHLPDWERVRASADYAVSLPALQAAAGKRPALDAVSFEGDAEAAVAYYGDACLVIVEFSTPQYSIDNDARIAARINELKAAGEPVPSAYRRVGNYSVFVFGAPDEQAAAGLLDRVKYEKDVRWLGDNPHRAEMAEKFYTMTMTGIIVTTLKATGLAILICLGVGGVFGGFVFLRRRAQRTASEAYADAGGMLQLSVDETAGAGTRAKFVDEGGKG
jgi:hypothetical protein